MKKGKSVLLLILVLLLLAGCGYTAFFGLGGNKSGSLHDIPLGLDLAGGVSITYEVAGEEKPSSEDMADTVYKLQRRVQGYSTEAQVYQEGANRVNIEIPGVSDASQILADLGQPGSLYFVRQKGSDGSENYQLDMNTYQTLPTKTLEELKKDGSIVLEGTDVDQASAGYEQSGNAGNSEAVVQLRLTKEGAEKFKQATTDAYAKGETIGIYYDGVIISAPRVNAVIENGEAVITGSFTYESANNLASMIRIGGLKVQLQELRSDEVGAQLGQNAIHTSLLAAVVGFGLVVVFMIAIYYIMGLAASIALAFYSAIVVILLSAFQVTLTLPGIAGIILSIGMAVDANVLVFARIREETMRGATVKAAMQEGYKKALSAIIDGNVTTLIAAAVLGILGTGTVKGFAITLALGIIVSMFTALFVTRWIMRIFYGLGIQDVKWYGKGKEVKRLGIIEKRKIFYLISVLAILSGFVTMGVNQGRGIHALNYSLDFVGGTTVDVTFNEQWSLKDLESQVLPKIEKETNTADIQVQTVSGTNEVIFKTAGATQMAETQRSAIRDMLHNDYGVDPEKVTFEVISATISNEMQRDAIIAVAVALALMLVYIWFRFRNILSGASAIIALAHDALIVLACYAISRIGVGGTFIASILTIIGYSINDTIVTFDRIRENLKNDKYKKDSLADVMDISISQTLTRSLFTSLTTFFMVLTLFVFGVTDIRDFALPLMAGIISGTYSSIFIASPLWYDLSTGIGKKKKVH